MLNPIIAWTNTDLIKLGDPAHPEVPSTVILSDGTGNAVLADTDSAIVSLAITNNFTNGTAITDAALACFDMKNCTLTVKDTNGGMDEQLVQQKWLRVKATSLGESAFTQIGAHLDGSTWVEDAKSIGCGDATVGVNNISGAINDGTSTGTGKNNIARFDLQAHPDATANPVTHNFKLRVTYTYGTGA